MGDPPEADAEFAAYMEEVLNTYQRPCDAQHPVARMDKQLVEETLEPLAGWRDAHARERRTKADSALCHCRRIGDVETLRAELTARSAGVNTCQRRADWWMRIEDARPKLKSVNPKPVS